MGFGIAGPAQTMPVQSAIIHGAPHWTHAIMGVPGGSDLERGQARDAGRRREKARECHSRIRLGTSYRVTMERSSAGHSLPQPHCPHRKAMKLDPPPPLPLHKRTGIDPAASLTHADEPGMTPSHNHAEPLANDYHNHRAPTAIAPQGSQEGQGRGPRRRMPNKGACPPARRAPCGRPALGSDPGDPSGEQARNNT